MPRQSAGLSGTKVLLIVLVSVATVPLGFCILCSGIAMLTGPAKRTGDLAAKPADREPPPPAPETREKAPEPGPAEKTPEAPGLPAPIPPPTPSLTSDKPNPALALAREAVRARQAEERAWQAEAVRLKAPLDTARKRAEEQASVQPPNRPAFPFTEDVEVLGSEAKPIPVYFRKEGVAADDPSFDLRLPTYASIVDDEKHTDAICHILIKTSGKYKGKEVWIKLANLPPEVPDKLREFTKKLAAFHAAQKAHADAKTEAANALKSAEAALKKAESSLADATTAREQAEAHLRTTPATMREVAAATKAKADTQKREEAALEAARKAEEEDDFDGLVLLKKTVKAYHVRFGGEITGTVVNRRSRTVRYAQITFHLYDADGAKVATAIGNINQLEPGEKWSFKAITLNENWTKYRVAEVVGR